MPTEPSLDIGLKRDWGYVPITIGMLFCAAGVFLCDDWEAVLLCQLCGIPLLLLGYRWLRDKSPKLTLSQDGLKDHRTGAFIRWTDFLQVRVHVETTNGHQSAATMYVEIRDTRGVREIAFDVDCLDMPTEEIVERVHNRGFAAYQKSTKLALAEHR